MDNLEDLLDGQPDAANGRIASAQATGEFERRARGGSLGAESLLPSLLRHGTFSMTIPLLPIRTGSFPQTYWRGGSGENISGVRFAPWRAGA